MTYREIKQMSGGMHKKKNTQTDTKYYCGDVLIYVDYSPSNRDCPECPICGHAFKTYGTTWSGTSMVEESG